MNDTSPLPDRDEQAALWCLSLADGTLSAEEHEAFELWLADPDNRAALRDQGALWDLTEAAAEHPAMIKARTRALDDYRDANERQWRRDGGTWNRRHALGGLAAAAAALLLAFTFLFPSGEEALRLSTNVGERRIAMLEDGSRLTLDAATAVEVRMTPDRRMITILNGRAKFDVAKDPLRPFSVQADRDKVVAVGTSFSVEKLDQAVSVVLYEGRVAVLRGNDDDKALGDRLQPGRALRLEAGGKTVLEPVALDRSLAWTDGRLDFANEPLASAVARVNRYARQPIVIDGDVPASVRVTGIFDANDPAAFLEGVAALNGLSVRREAERVLLTRG